MKSAFDWSGVDKSLHTKPEDRTWWQTALHYLGQILDYSLLIWAGWKLFGGTIRTVFGPIARLLGRLGLGRLIGGLATRGVLAVGAAAGAGGAAMVTGVGEILIAAAIAALIYKAGEWLFTNPSVQNVLKEGAEGFWDFIKSIFQNQQEEDPTTGSVQQPQGIIGRLTQGAGGVGPAGDPAKEGEVMGVLTGKYGLSREDAAAWVSNWEAESGLRPDITSGGGGYNEASTRAYGIMQWIGPRLKALRAYAAEHHEDIRSLDTQLEFWWHELHTNPAYKNILAHVAAARGRRKAEIVFHEGESGNDPDLEKYLPGHTSRFDPILSAPPVSGTLRQGSPVVQNNKTDINIQHGPNAASTATAVADKQDQVHREAVRTLRQAPIR
jgi:hypothetical protein